MDAPTLAKCAYQHCDLHLEFPVELNGTTVDCPGCKQLTVLSVAPPEAAAEGLTPAEVVAALPRPVPKTPVSFLYQFGLMWVTLAMLALEMLPDVSRAQNLARTRS